jgi:hypothetical protein
VRKYDCYVLRMYDMYCLTTKQRRGRMRVGAVVYEHIYPCGCACKSLLYVQIRAPYELHGSQSKVSPESSPGEAFCYTVRRIDNHCITYCEWMKRNEDTTIM